jgi:hypothetical protein
MWEAELEMRERVGHALREAERARLAWKAGGAEATPARGNWLGSINPGWRWQAIRTRVAPLAAAWSSFTNRLKPGEDCC